MQRLKNSTHHLRVTPRNDDEREKEAQQVQNDPVGYVLRELAVYCIVPTVPVYLHLPCICTSRRPKFNTIAHAIPQSPRHITGFGKSDDGAGKYEHHDPHGSTDASNCPLALQSDASDRMADAHVAMDGYAGKKEDTAVKIEVKQKTYQSAHEVSEDPMVTHYIAGHEERKREAVHQICGCQVDHVDQRRVPLSASPTTVGTQEDRGVQDDAEQER